MIGPLPAQSGYSLAAVYESISAAVPDRECIVYRDRRLTYAQVTDRTRRLAHVFHARGLKAHRLDRDGVAGHESHQDHLAIYLRNGNEYLESMLAAFKARVVPVNINYRYVAEELRHVLADSRSRGIIYQSTFAPILADVLPTLPELDVLIQVADESGIGLLDDAQWYEESLQSAPCDRPDWADEWSPDDLYILYTGGTTGLPKGVLWRQGDIHRTAMGGRNPASGLPWSSIDAMVEAAVQRTPVITLPSAPFMHGAGHWVALGAMNQGSTVVIQSQTDTLDPSDICATIERERVSFLQIVGDAFARPILDEMRSGGRDLSSLSILLSGGAPLTQATKGWLLEQLPDLTIIDGLGSSEGGGQAIQVTTKRTGRSSTFTPTQGSIVVDEGRSRVLEPGHDGIGWLAKQGDVPLGYLGDAEKTLRTFPTVDGMRLAIPGDRARLAPDGQIELLGRDSVTINSGGEKIFAEEVEAAISAHSAVADVVVAGRPSERWGSEVVAIVQLRSPASTGGEELALVAAQHIARYKLPKAWIFVDRIRRSPAGKPDYRWASAVAQTGVDTSQ